MRAQDRPQAIMTTPPRRRCVAAVLIVSLLPAVCVATIPFAPFGTANGDTKFANGVDTTYGPFSLPVPMTFPDGGQASQYYASTTGGIFFNPSANNIGYTTYTVATGSMIGAATSHMHATASSSGYYHRTISGSGPALDALWSDVLPGGIPIIPTAGLVFTVDNAWLYPTLTSIVSVVEQYQYPDAVSNKERCVQWR